MVVKLAAWEDGIGMIHHSKMPSFWMRLRHRGMHVSAHPQAELHPQMCCRQTSKVPFIMDIAHPEALIRTITSV